MWSSDSEILTCCLIGISGENAGVNDSFHNSCNMISLDNVLHRSMSQSEMTLFE